MASTGSLKKMVYLHQQQYNEITVKDENTVYITQTDNYGGVIGATGATFLPVVDANGNLGWSNNGGLPNPTTRNIKGANGAAGEKGTAGEKGDKGDAAFTVAVGTTQTLLPTQNAYVNNSGTPQDQVLNFGVPSGAKGDHGQSAFDYAEAGGYTKTEAEFQNEMAKFVYYDGSASTGVVWRGTQVQYDALTPLQKTETLLAVII